MDRRHVNLSVSRRRWFRTTLWAALCGLGVVGCGQPVPNGPPDATLGGTNAQLCQNDFQTCVMPVLSGQIKRRGGAVISCTDGNCHAQGGSGGRFSLGSDVNANFTAAKSLINF